MNCPEFQELTPRERTQYIGSLLHSCMSDSKLYAMGERIIKAATKQGLFEGVTINPIEVNNISEPNNETT